MPHLFVTLMKINLVLAVFAIAYYLILRRLTFYVLNRFFLVLGILFSSVYPFIDLTDFFHNQEQLSPQITTLVPAINQRVAALAPTDFFTQYGQRICILFYAGVAVMAVRFLLQFVSLYRLHKNSTRGVVNGTPVRILKEAVNPFSFWQTIYINPSLHKEQALPSILAHEHIHVKQWHTLDIMLAELSVVFYWFNPGVWLMNKAVKENLEFITDAKVLKGGADKKAYQYSLLDTGNMAVASATFANSFNIAGLKKRITMMNAQRSSRLSLSRYVLLIPVLLITTLLFAVSNRKVIQYVEPVIPQVVYAAITGASGSEHTAAPKKTTRKPAALYAEAAERKRAAVAERRAEEAAWRRAHPREAQTLDGYIRGDVPQLDWAAIAADQKQGVATRASSAFILDKFADSVGNMLVMSADLANSDKTDAFLKKTTPIEADSWSGAFLHCGVSEFSMADLAIGMALHGGVIPVCGTFFAFSDYQKPALRLAALMELPVKFLWTHDAFRVGEDGPTHQPIEQEAQLRLLEKVYNHHGRPGLLALRPADTAETTVAWKMALENTKSPTGLIFTRQSISEVIDYATAQGAKKGAYIAYEPAGTPELVVIANGSEVGTAMEAIKLLPGRKIRLVSVPSEGLFREQSADYQASVLPKGIPRFGITAGLSVNLLGLVGDINCIHGLNHFGFSAPYAKLNDEFGFTPEKIAKKLAAI